MGELLEFGRVVLLVAAGFSLALASSKLTERFPLPGPAIFLLAAALAPDVFPTLTDHVSIREVERIAVVALIVILFDGGMQVGWRRFRASAVEIASLGVLGTFATAGLMALAAHSFFGFSWIADGILGAALAPTDPAVMFSVLGNREVGGRTGTILEGESGANDPVGIVLMIGMLELALVAAAGGSARSQSPPKNNGQPMVSGAAVQGSTLTTSNGNWSGTLPFTYQYRWLRCDTSGGGVNGVNCANIPGETRKTYVLTGADVGHRIRSRVIASNTDGTASFNSNPTSVVKANAGPAKNAQPPTISGTPAENNTLTANKGSWTGAPSISYAYRGAAATRTAAAAPRSAARPPAPTCSSPSTSERRCASGPRARTVRARPPRPRSKLAGGVSSYR